MRFVGFLSRRSGVNIPIWFFSLLVPLSFLQTDSFAGEDVVILKNDDRITGEVQKLELGELYFDPDYGNGVFRFDWEDVKRIESTETFIARTSSGSRVVGSIQNDPNDSSRILIETEEETIQLEQMVLVKL